MKCPINGGEPLPLKFITTGIPGKQSNIQDLERTKVMLQEQVTARKNLLAGDRSAAGAGAKGFGGENALPGESDAHILSGYEGCIAPFWSNILISIQRLSVRKIIEKQEKATGASSSGSVSGKRISPLEQIQSSLSLRSR